MELFLSKLKKCRQLVIIAQKAYFERRFPEFNTCDEDLQDTSVPWDWDHIFPKDWVDHKWCQDDRTKDWEHTIGNLRIMSLSDNRSESNHLSPAERLNKDNDDYDNYFIKDSDRVFWSQLKQRGKISNNNESRILNHAKAIITRMVNIYKLFYDMVDGESDTIEKKYSSWSKRTIFKDAEWVCQLDLCRDWSERAGIVNRIFEGKFKMNEQDGSITQIGTATSEEQWGLAVIFVNATHKFRFLVKKEDFDEELLEDYYFHKPYSQRPAYPIRIEESPQEILFSVRAYPGFPPYSEDSYYIEGMLFDLGKENLLDEHWNTDDCFLRGSFDRHGNVIGKITA